MTGRIVASVISLVVYGWLNSAYSPIATLASGKVAGGQFANDDTAFLTTNYITGLLTGLSGALTFVLLVVLLLIWVGPAKRLFRSALMLAVLVLFAASDDAHAFFEKTERTEAYTIMPNESAFWIPDVGANKDSQAQLESESYLNANKLAVKRFIIPHQKLGNSGGYMGWDYYVPTGRLIILDRTPFSREWVDAEDRGTSKIKEGFPCQSKEGLNIVAGVSIGTSVLEKEAAKFLYRFGVTTPKGDRTSGEVIFTSVYYGRSLREVMDDVGRKKVQTLVCGEIGKRTFDVVNAESEQIMAEVEKQAREYFAAVGVTLDFIGWGDTFEFDKDVQKVVNDHYAAQKLAEAVPVLQAIMNLKVQEGLGAGLSSKGLPVVVTPGMMEAIIGLVKNPPAAAPAAAPQQ
jgi:hypothetical protein